MNTDGTNLQQLTDNDDGDAVADRLLSKAIRDTVLAEFGDDDPGDPPTNVCYVKDLTESVILAEEDDAVTISGEELTDSFVDTRRTATVGSVCSPRAPTFFVNLFSYSIWWTPAVALWAFAVGYQFLVGAALGFAVAAVGAAWLSCGRRIGAALLLNTRQRLRWPVAMATPRFSIAFRSIRIIILARILLLSGVVAAVLSWLSR